MPQMTEKLNTLQNMQHFHTNLGQVGGTLGMFTNYFQEVHFDKNYI